MKAVARMTPDPKVRAVWMTLWILDVVWALNVVYANKIGNRTVQEHERERKRERGRRRCVD